VTSFDDAYLQAMSFAKQSPSRHVRTLLQALFVELHRRPVEVSALKVAVVSLLEYLVSPAGRTSANCTAVDLFVCFLADEIDWYEILPQPIAAIVADMGIGLHDTVDSPDIARNSESTPELLLARIQDIA
jgi:hypothetical protein